MEAAHGDWNSGGAEWSSDVEGARVLVRLYADERNTSEIAVTPKAGEEHRHVNPGVGLVNHLDVDSDFRP
jgi:hypothetical protein